MVKIIVGVGLILFAQTILFQLDVQQMKQQGTREVLVFAFSAWPLMARIFLPALTWTAFNLLNRAGGTWFTLLLLTALARLIQIGTLAIRFNEWPAFRDWLGISLAFVAAIMTIKK